MTEWKKAAPAEPGLYIARRATRRAINPRCVSLGPMVRHWDGTRWSAPAPVDVARMPDASWPAARDEQGRLCRVEWLQPA